MDAAWDAVLVASLAVACAQGWRAASDPGDHVAALEGAIQAVGLGEVNETIAYRSASTPFSRRVSGATR